MAPPYLPRDTQTSVVVQLLHDHLDTFLGSLSANGQPSRLPTFVERQLRAMRTCGDLTLGFVRLECASCRGPRVVPFSCKARLCSCCAGRRMNEQAAHLVERVCPRCMPPIGIIYYLSRVGPIEWPNSSTGSAAAESSCASALPSPRRSRASRPGGAGRSPRASCRPGPA